MGSLRFTEEEGWEQSKAREALGVQSLRDYSLLGPHGEVHTGDIWSLVLPIYGNR